MTLSSTLSLAQSSLANTSAQLAVVSGNIANVNNPNYGRRYVGTITQMPGSVSLGPTQRAASSALLASLLTGQAKSSASATLLDGLTAIASMLGVDNASADNKTATDNSPQTLLSNLQTALSNYANQPDNASLAQAAVTAAKSLTTGLNTQATTVQTLRGQADANMATSVNTINSLLAQYQNVNDAIVRGTATHADIASLQDTRDGLLKQISQEVGISTVTNPNGSESIYTDGGVTLFETTARKVTFTPTMAFGANTTGGAVTIDGVPVTGANAIMPITSGALAGDAQLRDTTLPAYQNQLDQIATKLVGLFAESDQTGGGNPSLPGLFTSSLLGGAVPTSTVQGLAGNLSINASVDPAQGGTPAKLRDGNISSSNAAYTYNTSNAASYPGRLNALVAAMGSTQSFNPGSGGTATGSIIAYAQSSLSWVAASYQNATTDAANKQTVVDTTTTALSNATGVNLDDQLSQMLDIEHAYQASSQIMNTVGKLYTALFAAFN